MKHFAGLAALLVVLAMTGCDNPKKVVLPTDVAQMDTIKGKAAKLSEEDRGLLLGYVMRASLGKAFGGNGIPPGTTIGQAIELQKQWAAEQKTKAAEAEALKQQIETARAANAKAIDQAITVALVRLYHIDKDTRAYEFSDKQGIDIAVRNIGPKPIRGVKGRMVFIDVFDKPIGTIGLGITEDIAPGQVYTWQGTRDYNQFVESHKALWNLQEGKYTTRFEPEMIVFADGTKIGTATE